MEGVNPIRRRKRYLFSGYLDLSWNPSSRIFEPLFQRKEREASRDNPDVIRSSHYFLMSEQHTFTTEQYTMFLYSTKILNIDNEDAAHPWNR